MTRQASEQLGEAAILPALPRVDFDGAEEALQNGDGSPVSAGLIRKTSNRTVVSLACGCFEAHETVRHKIADTSCSCERSQQLALLVPSGARYGFDVIAYVGLETYLYGQSLGDVAKELAGRPRPIDIPRSTLWDQQQKFLFHLGQLHEQAAPRLRQYLAEQGENIWLLDGTLEPGTSVFLGIQEALSGLWLGGWKIPSENADDIEPCLKQAADRFGCPSRVLHDLNSAMINACDQALPGVPHFVCHYHLAHDVGEDLYRQPHAALSKRLRAMRVQVRMREQRKGQIESFRAVGDTEAQSVLRELLAGRPVLAPFHGTLGREVTMALHYWILDYRSDGRRRGFPFDPYLLYLHRRLVRAAEVADQLMANADVARQAPQVLRNLQKQLGDYRCDPQIVAAADAYERAAGMFGRLRDALRLSADQMANLREPHALPTSQQQEMRLALQELREELQQRSTEDTGQDVALARVVLTHLDKYWSHLIPENPSSTTARWERTTNKLESGWRDLKRVRRQTHGRGKLTRDFNALPAEYLLVPNLENASYLEVVLEGSLEALPTKLAEASRQGPSFEAWRCCHHPCLPGQLPHRLLRDDNFLPYLLTACADHCLLEADA